MIDASRGFLKDGNKNRLRAQDIHRIVDVFNRQIELPRYSRMVPVAEIAGPANEYNLNIPRYVDSIEPEDLLARFADLALLDRWGSQRLLSHQPAQVPPLLLGLSRDSNKHCPLNLLSTPRFDRHRLSNHALRLRTTAPSTQRT